MEGNLRACGSDVAGMHVKTEEVDENPSALVLGRGNAVHVWPFKLIFVLSVGSSDPVSTDRFFTTSADGKTYLKIAPAAVMPPAPSEKTVSSGSDFSSKAVLCLIEAIGRRWGLYDTRERSQLFQSVQEEMASKGHILPVEKIRRKWNNLIVTYKRVKDRSRETGHAKTSWEFFDLMEATLSDTIGTQIINNKRHKGGSTFSPLSGPMAKIAAKPAPLPQPATIIRASSDFASAGGVESVGPGMATSQINCSVASSSLSAATISPINAPELKPLIVLNGDTSLQPASIVPTPTYISSPCFTDTASTSPSLGSASSTDLSSSGCPSRKAASFTSGVIPFRLSTAPLSHSQNVLGLSSFPPTSSCLPSTIATSLPAATMPGAEGQNQKGSKEQSSFSLFEEILKRQEEQAYLDRVARRRVEAREKRRERREVRMSESLGRIATALELLSSKQDTIIALLQRLADRK
ncbi:uncharacterized protein FYW49_015381 [Xenentodon cancila]